MTAVRHSINLSKLVTNEQDMKKDSKIVTFYKNGDIYFSGYVVTITPRRYRSFEVLLSELSRITNLPQGVRYLLDRESGTRIEAIEQLQDGKAYVCASNSRLKKLDYGKKNGGLPQWGSRNKIELPALTNPPKKPGIQASSRYVPLAHTRHAGTRQEAPRNTERISYKARNVTIIRNGHKPRISTRVLLSKRTAHSVNQFLDIVNDSLGVTGASNVRKLYTSKGRQIYEVSDLFNDETGVFIAVGNERFRTDEIENILNDDNKGTAGGKRTVKSLGKSSNGGMKHERENKRTSKEHEDILTDQDVNKKTSLPALPDLEVKKNKNSFEIRSKVADVSDNSSIYAHQKPNSPRHKKTVSKQTHSTTRENKNDETRADVNANSVKLPQIGTGHNLVTTQETQQATNTKTKTDHQDSLQGVAEEKEKLKESIEKEKNEKHAEQKVKKRPSKDFTNHEIEEEYSRVTDKKVEDVYDIGRKIGDGNFAIVRQCTNKTNKKEFALKIIDKKKIRGKEKMIDDEIAIMRKCRHPNIVRLFEDYDTTTDIYLVMELIKGGDLFDAISSSVKFTENVAKTYFRDMCKALAYLHKMRVVHRDMKPENLLVSIYCHVIGWLGLYAVI